MVQYLDAFWVLLAIDLRENPLRTNTSASQFSPVTGPSTQDNIHLEEIPSAVSVLRNLPERADQKHVVYTKIQKKSMNHNIPQGFFNQTVWKPQQSPRAPLINLPRSQWDKNQLAISTGPEPVWVDLVVNNLDEGPHSFHLHGHYFYILTVQDPQFGWGSYNPFEDTFPPGLEPEGDIDPDHYQPYNLSSAALRDTVQIPSRGYAVLRFRADNPGVWLFYCHIVSGGYSRSEFGRKCALLLEIRKLRKKLSI